MQKKELLITIDDQEMPYSQALELQNQMRKKVAEGRKKRKDKYAHIVTADKQETTR